MSFDYPLDEPASPSATWRAGRRALFGLLDLFLAWLAAYATGAFPWIGYAWLDRSSFGAGPITIIGESRVGAELGLNEFLFFKGQDVVVGYDARIEAGSLWFHVFRPFDGKLGEGVSHHVTESGAGEWTVPIRKTGIYHITVEPSVVRGNGSGWDLAYTAWWGARPGR